MEAGTSSRSSPLKVVDERASAMKSDSGHGATVSAIGAATTESDAASADGVAAELPEWMTELGCAHTL